MSARGKVSGAREVPFAKWVERVARARPPAPPSLAPLREASRAAFLASGLPGARDEAWRYTNLAPLHALPLEYAAPERVRSFRHFSERVSERVGDGWRAHFMNGDRHRDAASLPFGGEVPTQHGALATGEAALLPLEEQHCATLGALVDAKQHPFAALNGALLEFGALLRIVEGAQLAQPLHLDFASFALAPERDADADANANADARVSFMSTPRLVIEVGAGARATVVQTHRAEFPDVPHFCNAVVEIAVGENATLDYVLVQDEGARDVHISNVAASVQRGGAFHSHVITLGGRLVRNDLAVTLAGEDAACQMNGLFLGADERLVDNHTLVDHALPRGRSQQLYKGVLEGAARGVFRGRVLVRPDAQHTDAGQSNPNLLLSDRADLNTKPQLEIHADDVQCRHGATIGRLDEDALFYLRARGLAREEARALLVRAFASEVLGALPDAALQDALRAEVGARLGAEDAS